MYKSQYDDCLIRVEKARAEVERTTAAYARGGSVTAMNKANRELADAHAYYREHLGLRVPLPDR